MRNSEKAKEISERIKKEHSEKANPDLYTSQELINCMVEIAEWKDGMYDEIIHNKSNRCQNCLKEIRYSNLKKNGDHEYMKRLGYNIEEYSDCTFHVKELPGLTLTGYNDQGSLASYASDSTRQVVLDMITKGIITAENI